MNAPTLEQCIMLFGLLVILAFTSSCTMTVAVDRGDSSSLQKQVDAQGKTLQEWTEFLSRQFSMGGRHE